MEANDIYGPLTKSEFVKKRSEQDVNSELELVNPKEYRDLDKDRRIELYGIE